MKLLALWLGVSTPSLLLSSRGEAVAPLTTAHLLWGLVLVCGPLATFFGLLLVLYALQHLQPPLVRSLITAALSILFLATVGATGTGLQLFLTALSGSTMLALVLIGALSAILIGALGYGGQAMLRLSTARLAFWGSVLIVGGFCLTSVVVTMTLLITSR